MAALVQTPLKSNPAFRQMTVEEFLELPFEGRAELEDGILYMMGGGSPLHAAITANIIVALGTKLRGSGCRPMSPDMVVRTGPASLRMPDASVYCRSDWSEVDAKTRLIGDPKVVFEVLSQSTSRYDQEVKLNEYRSLTGLEVVVFVDPEGRRVRLVERTGPEAWTDRWLDEGADVPLPSIGVNLSPADIFDLN
jgi:Uma2 family endonuclease